MSTQRPPTAPARSTKYQPAEVEARWYAHWQENGYFRADAKSQKPAHSIVIPPPNVTGILHMGHMLNNTIQDILTRRARMRGFEAVWVPGTDHASIATEAKVVNKLKADTGQSKQDVGREKFLDLAWEWTDKYGGIIIDQLKKLGCSCDWDRERFTMEPKLSEAVIEMFVHLHEKGYLYRGERMVNWDPIGLTAVSDEEVVHKEKQSKLYYVRYDVVGEDGHVVIATTRPETIMGDTAICFHPDDARYKHLKGKQLRVPIVDREVPAIFDDYIDPEFGTGSLKVTPAHDPNDFALGQKHGLKTIDVFNADGTLNEHGGPFAGMDRFAARKALAKWLEENGLLVKVEEIQNKVGHSERTDAVIEPRLSQQWFCRMEELSKFAVDAVRGGDIKIYPSRFENLYFSWAENVRDWCISRQLWWGHRIPAWYLPSGETVVAKNEEEALAKAQQIDPKLTLADLKQDEDVLDTWFSSWLWPMSVFDGVDDPQNPEVEKFYPVKVLVTGFDIIFFWVIRMIMAGYELRGERPFESVYFTGMVRDKQGRKMSKSLGNSPDPLGLIDTFGADGVRVGMLLSAPAGNDILFDEKLCEQGRNFANKLWNAFRLVEGWETKVGGQEQPLAVAWFEARLAEATAEIDAHFETYRISDALMTVYKLVWDDFCSWYLEMAKPPYGDPIGPKTARATRGFLEAVLKLLHPFMPFISEELWQQLEARTTDQALIVSEWPSAKEAEQSLLSEGAFVQQAITALRNLRAQKNLSPKEPLTVHLKSQQPELYARWAPIFQSLAGIESFTDAPPPAGAAPTIVGPDELLIALPDVDLGAEKEALEKELTYMEGFLQSVEKKLSNERFVSGAPAQVLENERKKQSDAQAKISAIRASLAAIG